MRFKSYRFGARWEAMIFAFVLAFILAGIAGAWRLPFLAHTDLEISRALQRTRTPFLDVFMTGATWLGSGIALTLVALAAAVALLRFERRREAVAAALSLASLLLNIGLKTLANRPRPGNPIQVITETYGSSFPSGHSMGSAAVYGTLAALTWSLTRRKAPVGAILAIPVAVGLSRIYLGAHWGYDVMAGWAAGALWAAVVVAWLRGSATPEAPHPGPSPDPES